ncbi:NADH dehydrogenase subunit L [Salegentibacter echinorum]|uniref:NADH dehydrogenase subunit L n=1 Tax=Salegentibacter echinorum TaxID=1073325 RepID=A0A1M5BL08_SALEC|nr:NADH-quinone oxidoreductase subunit L [Salegentibacter echinorum]SHF43050.1 NADH dehydrogenase subunit L [Salegentibacter echinorum]
MSELFLWILILAPIGAALFGYIFRNGSSLPHLIGVSASLLGSLFLFLNISQSFSQKIEFGGLADFPFVVVANYQNALLALVVSVVALAIFIYAKGYMEAEKGKRWFWPAMSLFLAAMQVLVMAGDWFLFITGWELMGLASFLLIGTWHEKKNARLGSVKAFMLTRFADMGLYAGAFLTIITYNQLAVPFSVTQEISVLAASCFLLAVMGKSAQLPFQSWLSGAMAGPTPVSALLHSATMVGAGALLLFKIYPILPEEALLYIGIIGCLTIILTGLTAITSKDLKQMLAASTSSQLGFMLLAIGAGFPGAAFAHWLAHAFMKSTLFLGAGVFQQGYESTQYKKIAGSGKQLKVTHYTFIIAALALTGIPPLIGYWSKDGILEASLISGNWFFVVSGVLGAFFTASYVSIAVRWLWKGKAEKPSISKKNLMLTGIFILIILVIAGGFGLEPIVKKIGYSIPKGKWSMVLGLVAALFGLLTGWFYRENWLPGTFTKFSRENYTLAGGYQNLVVNPTLKTANFFQHIDAFILEYIEKIGYFGLNLSQTIFKADRNVKTAVWEIGNSGIWLSSFSQIFDLKILISIKTIASSIKESGYYGKKWQSGLVHKELAITIISLLILIFILIISLIELL